MRLDDPDALCLAYTRKMMAFLLFNSGPRRMLQLGLGGGSLAKFCYRHLPDALITVLEIDSHVLALREEFRVPLDDSTLPCRARRRLRSTSPAVRRGKTLLSWTRVTAPASHRRSQRMTSNPKSETAPDLNGRVGREPVRRRVRVENHICQDSRRVFGQRLIALPAKEDGNLIVLGFRRTRNMGRRAAGLCTRASWKRSSDWRSRAMSARWSTGCGGCDRLRARFTPAGVPGARRGVGRDGRGASRTSESTARAGGTSRRA